MASYSGDKDDCELPMAQKLLQESASILDNATITSDALHTQKNRKTCLRKTHKAVSLILSAPPIIN